MNRFSLDLVYDAAGGLQGDRADDFADPRLRLRSENLHPPLRVHRRDSRIVAIAGNPIADDRRDDAAVLAALEKSRDERAFLVRLNGSFLVILYDSASGILSIGNDRFASLAFYYSYESGRLRAGLSAKALYDDQSRRGRAISEDALFEFLCLRRLLGEKTFDPGVHYLRSAAILRLEPGAAGPRVETYWQPDYGAARPRSRHLPDALAEGLRHAVAIHTADQPRCALLLSGGLDSRAILAAIARPPLCLTTALSRNNEVEVAREVADAAGAEHRFAPRPADLYDPVLDDAVFLSGGMQIYNEAQFLRYGPAFAGLAETILIGLGLDIFFGGLYLPKANTTLFGRPALHHRLLPLSDDIAQDYISGVKYRLRSSDPFTVVRPSARARLRDGLRHAVEEILARGRALGAAGYDLWEYLHLHNLSRHYSFPMMASVRTFADCRAPALENGLFDLAIGMTAEQKLDGTPYQRAIARLNPRIMALRNANTNLRAAHPLRRQTAVKALAVLGNRLFGTGYPVSPGWRERSWPSPKAMLADHPGIRELIRGLPRSERLAAVSFLDMDGIASTVAEHESGSRDHAILLNLLLTLDRCLDPGVTREFGTIDAATRSSSISASG